MEPKYKQFCPVAMAAEILCTRWTMVLLREFIAGSTRFNDLRRGVPKMSPSLLSKRLTQLVKSGVLKKTPSKADSTIFEYHLTQAGRDLQSVIESIGIWGQKWVESTLSLQNLDPALLMWDMRRNLNPEPLPKQKVIIQFKYPELPSTKQNWWLIIEECGTVDLCWSDPGFEINSLIETDLRTMTSIWMGLSTVKSESNKVKILGDKTIKRNMQTWLGLSPFAKQEKLVS